MRKSFLPILGGDNVEDAWLLDVRQIVSGYGNKEILHGISCRIKSGEIVALIGPNGSGKSTVLLTVLGYLKKTGGNVAFKNRDISRLETNKIIELGIGFCPQGRTIFPEMTQQRFITL